MLIGWAGMDKHIPPYQNRSERTTADDDEDTTTMTRLLEGAAAGLSSFSAHIFPCFAFTHSYNQLKTLFPKFAGKGKAVSGCVAVMAVAAAVNSLFPRSEEDTRNMNVTYTPVLTKSVWKREKVCRTKKELRETFSPALPCVWFYSSKLQRLMPCCKHFVCEYCEWVHKKNDNVH